LKNKKQTKINSNPIQNEMKINQKETGLELSSQTIQKKEKINLESNSQNKEKTNLETTKEKKSNSQKIQMEEKIIDLDIDKEIVQENSLDSFFDEIFEIQQPKKEFNFQEMKTICVDGDEVLISSDTIKIMMSDYHKIESIQEWFSHLLQYTKKKLLNCEIILIFKESKLTNPINSKIRIENVNIVKYYEFLKKKEKVLLISSNNLISKKVEHPQITLMNPRKGLNLIVETLLDNRITESREIDKWLSNDIKKFLQKKKKEIIVTSPTRKNLKIQTNSDSKEIPKLESSLISKIPKKQRTPVILDDDNEISEEEIISLPNAEYSIPKDFTTLQITDSKGISNYDDMMIIVTVIGKVQQMTSHKEGIYEVKFANKKEAINALKELQNYPYEIKPLNKSGFLIKDRKRSRPKENEELNKSKIQKIEASVETQINSIFSQDQLESPKIPVVLNKQEISKTSSVDPPKKENLKFSKSNPKPLEFLDSNFSRIAEGTDASKILVENASKKENAPNKNEINIPKSPEMIKENQYFPFDSEISKSNPIVMAKPLEFTDSNASKIAPVVENVSKQESEKKIFVVNIPMDTKNIQTNGALANEVKKTVNDSKKIPVVAIVEDVPKIVDIKKMNFGNWGKKPPSNNSVSVEPSKKEPTQAKSPIPDSPFKEKLVIPLEKKLSPSLEKEDSKIQNDSRGNKSNNQSRSQSSNQKNYQSQKNYGGRNDRDSKRFHFSTVEDFRKLEIRGFSPTMDTDEIKELFYKFGEIEKLDVSRKQEIICCVTFKFHKDAKAAMEKYDGQRFNNVFLSIKPI
jgi:hypothetical protein